MTEEKQIHSLACCTGFRARSLKGQSATNCDGSPQLKHAAVIVCKPPAAVEVAERYALGEPLMILGFVGWQVKAVAAVAGGCWIVFGAGKAAHAQILLYREP